MYEKLQELISNGDYKEALFEFQEEYLYIGEKSREDAARLCVLEASIWEALEDSYAEFDAISRGIGYDPCNYELFYMLGLYYKDININKAYLCVQQALHYCNVPDDAAVIRDMLFDLKKDPAFRVRNVSIMVLSYNDLELLKECIESIEKTAPEGGFEVVVVDNFSTDERVVEYLQEKKSAADYHFTFIANYKNSGFPLGCNLGAKNCFSENDIFFLNNDAVLMDNSLFFLRMGLYENRDVGATSALSNSASLQELGPDKFEKYAGRELDILWHKDMPLEESLSIFKGYATDNGVPRHNPYIKRFRLTGFALMVSREALRVIAPDGEVFDGRFSPGYFEDDDLGIRLSRAGFLQYICDNSFVFHNGGGGFEGHADAMEKSRQTFADKWGFDVWAYSLQWEEACIAIEEIYKEKKKPLRIIDFTCGFGATAAYLKHKFPDFFIAGVCSNPFAASIAQNLADEVSWGNLNLCRLPWSDHSFDVALISRNEVCKVRASQYVKNDGIIIDEESLEEVVYKPSLIEEKNKYMRCPSCKQVLNDKISAKLNFCPLCGTKLYYEDRNYLLHIYSVGQRDNSASALIVFIDERLMYEVKPGDGLMIPLNGGFHSLKFRCGVRTKAIQIIFDSDFEIKAYFNTLTGLIETSILPIDGTQEAHTSEEVAQMEIAQPIMVSEAGERGFDTLLGVDEPDYSMRATSGFLEGVLRLYSDRMEFSPDGNTRDEVTDYIKIVDVKKKMGAIDVECAGNVHKVYSIPKDIYNEVIVYLTNRIKEVTEP